MILFPPKPSNSTIDVQDEANQTTISWKNPHGSASRYLIVIFMLAWLGGWAVGLYSVGNTLLSGDVNPFLIFWMIAWTVGGLMAIRNVYILARPTKPERLTFDSISLNYKRGTVPFGGVEWNFGKRNNDELFKTFQKIKNKYSILKKDIGDVKLERIGENQRLTIDYGSERIEIGEFLQEPEREWLLEVLKKWKSII